MIYRYLLLGGLFDTAGVGLWLSRRRDRHRSRGKIFAMLGLLLVLVYITARLVPRFRATLDPPAGWFIEAACFGLILFGLCLGWRDEPPDDHH